MYLHMHCLIAFYNAVVHHDTLRDPWIQVLTCVCVVILLVATSNNMGFEFVVIGLLPASMHS